MDRLPQELYGEIISHIPNIQDISSVSLASHPLHHEAEPFLWRSVNIDKVHVVERLTHFSTTRVARHIQSLRVVIWNASVVDLLRAALQATSNLKALEIFGQPGHPVTLGLGYLTQGSTFKLHRLLTYLPISPSCREFFRRQTQLVDMELSLNIPLCPPTDFFSPTDLPSLTILSAIHSRSIFIEVLLLGRKITHLQCWEFDLALTRPFETLVVLDIGFGATFASHVWDIFPNLRSISFHHKNKFYIAEIVKNLPHLTYVRMFYVGTINNYSSSAFFARELYQNNLRLEGVEITHLHEGTSQRWRLERGCDPHTPASLPLGRPGRDDWKHW